MLKIVAYKYGDIYSGVNNVILMGLYNSVVVIMLLVP